MTKSQDNISTFIQQKRERMGLNYVDFAKLLDMKEHGERTVRGWENGEHKPTPSKLKKINDLPETMPFKNEHVANEFKFIDLFAGIGGLRLPFQRLGGECVFTSEFDKFAQRTYAANFGEVPSGDITEIAADAIPDHDVLLAGFPCQAFSQAGLKRGFNDTRGTMFFEIQRILAKKRPKAFLLENVKTLQSHNKRQTFQTILDSLQGENRKPVPDDVQLSQESREALSTPLNYKVYYKILRAADFGIPQNRERIFIVGFDRDYFGENCQLDGFFEWPDAPMTPTQVGDILETGDANYFDPFTISDKLWEGHQRRKVEHKQKGNGFGYSLFNAKSTHTNTISARYYKDGSEILIDQNQWNKNPRKLTPRECANLQGFPKEFIVDAVSKNQIYKQFGNSVCVPVIQAVAQSMCRTINTFSPK